MAKSHGDSRLNMIMYEENTGQRLTEKPDMADALPTPQSLG